MEPTRMLTAPPGTIRDPKQRDSTRDNSIGNSDDKALALPNGTPIMRRAVSAPQRSQGIRSSREDILRQYNYWESEFEKKNPEHRQLKLQRILVELGYNPDKVNSIVRDIQTNSIREAVESLLESKDSKDSKKADAQDEQQVKQRLEQLKKIVKELEGPADDSKSLRAAMPILQKQLSSNAEEKAIVIIASDPKGEEKELVEEEQNLLKEDRETAKDKITCGICLEDLPKSMYDDTECGHHFCLVCWTRYLETRIQDGQVAKLCCPEYKCAREISEAEIKQCVEEGTLEKYYKFKRNCEIVASKDCRFCIAPDCDGVITKQLMKRRAVCDVCNQAICWTCGEAFHRGSCEKAAKESKNNAYQIYKILHSVKRCPNCRVDIEKNSGCNHMTCYQCKYEFCWICGGKYTSNHFAPYNIFGCANMQDGECAFFGDDDCLCIPCGCLTCECECGGQSNCRFNPVGFTKRFFTRLMCAALMIPCCPCIALCIITGDEDCCDD
mmetsp:Transcript_17574/g.42892  ORF Transcript_17574/g.42892 Transcript_17574/m.42892 type:complete len:497 (-) Transcript_17574:193-1683(-)